MDLILDNGKTVRQVVRELNREKYYMTGREYRFIIRHWGVSLNELAKATGYKSHASIIDWENKPYVTKKHADALKEMLGGENFQKMRQIYSEVQAKNNKQQAM